MSNRDFVAVNIYIYNSICGVFYDGVIWALGPIVDDSRTYGWSRMMLARATCTVCRRVLRVED